MFPKVRRTNHQSAPVPRRRITNLFTDLVDVLLPKHRFLRLNGDSKVVLLKVIVERLHLQVLRARPERRPALLGRDKRVRAGQIRRARVLPRRGRLPADLRERRDRRGRRVARREVARDAQRDADDDQRRGDALPRGALSAPLKNAAKKEERTHVDLHGHDGDDGLRGMPQREEHDEHELRDEVEHAALDDDRDRVLRGARGAREAAAAALVRGVCGVPEARDDERGREHVRRERERVPREPERDERGGRDGRIRVERDDDVDEFHDACCVLAELWG